jgi:cephalosporin-C deacetylase-like acetyl esterase
VPLYDLPLDELRAHRTEATEPTAYNAIRTEKEIVELPFSGHDVPASVVARHLADFTRTLGAG